MTVLQNEQKYLAKDLSRIITALVKDELLDIEFSIKRAGLLLEIVKKRSLCLSFIYSQIKGQNSHPHIIRRRDALHTISTSPFGRFYGIMNIYSVFHL